MIFNPSVCSFALSDAAPFHSLHWINDLPRALSEVRSEVLFVVLCLGRLRPHAASPSRSIGSWSRTASSSAPWRAATRCTSCAARCSWPRWSGRAASRPTSPPTPPSPTWGTCWAGPASTCSPWWGSGSARPDPAAVRGSEGLGLTQSIQYSKFVFISKWAKMQILAHFAFS